MSRPLSALHHILNGTADLKEAKTTDLIICMTNLFQSFGPGIREAFKEVKDELDIRFMRMEQDLKIQRAHDLAEHKKSQES